MKLNFCSTLVARALTSQSCYLSAFKIEFNAELLIIFTAFHSQFMAIIFSGFIAESSCKKTAEANERKSVKMRSGDLFG